MIRIKSVSIANIGRFVGTHSITFENRPLLIQVDASNKNTGGSSGSGKSTVFNALEYLFGVNEIPATILQSRLTKEPISVEAEIELDGTTMTIGRSKKEGFYLKSASESVTGNSKLAEERFQQLVGIPSALMRKMFHKRQKEGGFFLGMTPKECHEFMAECLDLKVWSAKIDKVDLDTKTAQQAIDQLSPKSDSLRQLYTALQNSASNIQPPLLGWDERILITLEKNMISAGEQFQSIQMELQRALNSVSKPSAPAAVDESGLAPIKSSLQESRAQLEFERAKAKAVIADLESKKATLTTNLNRLANIRKFEAPTAEAKLEELKQKIIHTKDSKCPTCFQSWEGGTKDAMLASCVVEAKKTAEALNTFKAQLENEPKLQDALVKIDEELGISKKLLDNPQLESKIKQYELSLQVAMESISKQKDAAMQAYRASVQAVAKEEADIKEKYTKNIEHLQNNYQMHRDIFNQHQVELTAYKNARSKYDNDIARLNSDGAKASQDLEQTLIQLKQTQDRLALCQEASRFLKSYVNQMFQDTLAQIALKATEMLSKIPNMSTSTIYFDTLKETKSGSIKEEINAVLTMDGEIGIPVKSMSGGERTAVDLAVDLAVIDMIEAKTGKGFDLFILDEPFDGLDSACREQSLELLKANMTSKRIVIVDHSNETKEMVPDRIFVIRDGQESHFV